MTARLEAAVSELVAALRAEMAEAAPSVPLELLSVAEAARRAGIGRTLLYNLIGRDVIRSVRVGGRRLIPADALASLATNEAATPARVTAREEKRDAPAQTPTG